ncbi:MarC family protein [Marinobacter sp. AC-23]|uniref:MarC family protein n=1 Tax=Marinobacter sp. AC-23 TaxID=1879031 RepID=UPI000A6AEFBD
MGVILFFGGPLLFSAIGITLDSFRIGAGTLLFLTAISLVTSGTRNHATGLPEEDRDDIAVVPLAVPVMIARPPSVPFWYTVPSSRRFRKLPVVCLA